MCVIAHQPAGSHLDKEAAQKLWVKNSDGGGFAYIDDDKKLVVHKEMEFNAWWSKFEFARSNNTQRDFLVHMRIATHGSVRVENVHPFQVDEYTVMAHNGILSSVTDKIPAGDDRTDTQFFIDEVLPGLPETWLDNEYLLDMVDDYIGWSKLMFLTTNPKLSKSVYRLGDWTTWKGLHLSNTSGLVPAVMSYSGRPTVKILGKETSDDWDIWSEYRTEQTNVLSSDELLDMLEMERFGMGIYHDIIRNEFGIDADTEYDCHGCGYTIDTTDASCLCWDLVCVECWRFLANCELKGECNNKAPTPYDNLSAKGKAFVDQGGKNKKAPNDIEKTLAALPLPEGAGNTKQMTSGGTTGSSI